MARVNIEDRAFSDRRLWRLSKKMNWTEQQALGYLAFLWHGSQDILKKTGTADDIKAWCKMDGPEGDAFVSALTEVGYIREKSGKFLVVGNDDQVENLLTLKRSRKAAAKERWRKEKEKRKVPEYDSHTTQDANAMHNDAQFNAIQDNSIQNKLSSEESAAPVPGGQRHQRGATVDFQGKSDTDRVVMAMLAGVKQDLQDAWINTYGDLAWLRQEILKAVAWEKANPRKASKDKGRFLTNWFSRGWERYRKTLPSGGGQTPADRLGEKLKQVRPDEV